MKINKGNHHNTNQRREVAVTIDDSQRDSSYSSERNEEIAMTPQSRSVQETDSSLQFSNHFHDINGFILKYNHSHSPDITTPPKLTIIARNQFAPSMWTFGDFSKLGILDLKQGGQEVLSFSYQLERKVFGRAEKRVAHIYLHRQNESCGKVECTEAGLKATISDYSSESFFTLSQISMNPTPRIAIQDSSGNVAAVAVAVRGKRNLRRDKTWTEFKFTWSSNHLPSSVKAVLTVAFFMWVFIYEEKKARERRIITCISLSIFSIFVGFPLLVISLIALYYWILEEIRQY